MSLSDLLVNTELMTSSIEFESVLEGYPVRLEKFEGPLDLLLHLIRKNEISIYDISMVVITEQYLQYLELMKELNLDVAGEFLLMAATLIHIKSRMLVPRLDPIDAESEEDPRDVLIQRLIEHQKFKAAAELLHEREVLRSAQWLRPVSRVAELIDKPFEPELEVDLFGLLQAFQALVQRAGLPEQVMLPQEQISMETRIEQMLTILSDAESYGFEDLFVDVLSRAHFVITFLALLEMLRLKLVRVYQETLFGPIRVYKRRPVQEA